MTEFAQLSEPISESERGTYTSRTGIVWRTLAEKVHGFYVVRQTTPTGWTRAYLASEPTDVLHTSIPGAFNATTPDEEILTAAKRPMIWVGNSPRYRKSPPNDRSGTGA